MIKKIINIIFVILFVVFLFLFTFGDYIYKNKVTTRKELTEEQIKKFEDDIKAGIELDLNKYLIKDNNYQNKITEINSNISHVIEKLFKKLFEHFLKNIDI